MVKGEQMRPLPLYIKQLSRVTHVWEDDLDILLNELKERNISAVVEDGFVYIEHEATEFHSAIEIRE